MDNAQSPSKGAERVSELVNEAASDITFYMQKAPLFDFTLLNSGSTFPYYIVLLKFIHVVPRKKLWKNLHKYSPPRCEDRNSQCLINAVHWTLFALMPYTFALKRIKETTGNANDEHLNLEVVY